MRSPGSGYISFGGDVDGVSDEVSLGLESATGVLSSFDSSLMEGSSDFDDLDVVSSLSIFLLLPLGAGSRGVRQYVTVLVTTCRTLTLPDLPLASASVSRGEKDALHGAAESGVDEYAGIE